jgi:hypothetical protein
MEPSGDDAQAHIQTAESLALTQVHTLAVQDASQAQTAETLSMEMRTHLWISWARIALKHEATAHAVRQEIRQPDADQSRLLVDEADAGLVSICAAAFALEALSKELNELDLVSAATLAAWSNKGLADEKQILVVRR